MKYYEILMLKYVGNKSYEKRIVSTKHQLVR